jgi:hypothetical protein
MDKKKILIGVGFLALIGGVSYYFYSKSKKPADSNEDSGSAKYTSASEESMKQPPTGNSLSVSSVDKLAGEPVKVLETRKEKRKACGIKPLFKKKKALWERCVAEGGIASFEGDFDEFEESYMDFDNNFDITF